MVSYYEGINNIFRALENGYLRAFLIFSFFVILVGVVFIFLKPLLQKIAKKTNTNVDDLLLAKLEIPVLLIIVIGGLNYALTSSLLINGIINKIINTLIIVLSTHSFVLVFDILIRLWEESWRRKTKSKAEEIVPFFITFVNVFIYIIGLVFILNLWGIQIGPLLASLGIAGLAISFAMKDALTNIVGGVALVMDKSFRTGDVIKLETGEMGIIKNIGVRSTKVETFDRELMIIPNGKLSESTIVNYAKPTSKVRAVIPVSVAYGSDVDKVEKVLLDSLKGIEGLNREEDPRVIFIKMNDFSLDFELWFYVDDYSKRFFIKHDLIKKIYGLLIKNNIQIPFPTRTLYMKKE